MKIFVTNDDGFDSRGLESLVDVAREFSDQIVVVAPDKGYSGMSHAITMGSPLFVEKNRREKRRGVNSFICTGSPVDCVKVGLDELMKGGEPDLILSGINHGSNSNISVIYSGTMGAATEGAFYGIPSLGFSLTDHNVDADLDGAVRWTREVLKWVLGLSKEERKGLCLNVNIPTCDIIKGVKFCRQTKGCWREDFVAREDPRGRDYYWMSGRFYNAETEATDTDEWALANGYVAVVPVQMDLTDYARLERFRSSNLEINNEKS